MKLYPIPGGGWAGTEADWKAGMKAAGLNPKDFEATKFREVPTGKKELMEFLTFFSVDVYRTGTGADAVVSGTVDVEALRDRYNPTGKPSSITVVATEGSNGPSLTPAPLTSGLATTPTLAELFAAAPINLQAELAVGLIDRLTKTA